MEKNLRSYHIAQLNIARLKYELDSPQLEDFVENLERINQLAEQSPGFIWRLQTEQGDATSIDYFGKDMIVNMSVWKDIESLHDYVYRSAHNQFIGRRKEWFERMQDAYTVLWSVPDNHLPSLQEAKQKLELLQQNGPSDMAFTFKKAYPSPNNL